MTTHMRRAFVAAAQLLAIGTVAVRAQAPTVTLLGYKTTVPAYVQLFGPEASVKAQRDAMMSFVKGLEE